MSVTKQQALEALRSVRYPGFRRDIVSLGVVRALRIDDGSARVEIEVSPEDAPAAAAIGQAAESALRALEGIERVGIDLHHPSAGAPQLKMAGARPSVAAAGALDRQLLPEVEATIAVASGKGGVGKSTVAVNLAVALARQGARVGLLDADIYGPSIPMMMGVAEQPTLTPERKLVPFERFGVRLMSLGFLVPADSALIWRGPMVMKAIDQLLRDVVWGALDILVVDMPPGTGDAQLTLSQKVRLAGAVIVTTPQDVALADAIKGVAMFRKVDVPVLGVVENMSYFECPHCSTRSEIFGHGGARREAGRLDVPFLGEVPLEPTIRSGGDAGDPIVHAQPDSPQAAAFLQIAEGLRERLGRTDEGAATDRAGGLFDRFRKVWDESRR